jgi:Zn-dependent M28 family amino/carboxypeptidase
MRRLLTAAVAMSLAAAALASPGTATAVDEVNTKRLRDAVTVNGILQHERAFQRIANSNGGTRASGTAGYDASADYVVNRLERAGYSVRRQTFTFPFFRELAPGSLTRVAPAPEAEFETSTLEYSGDGDVTGTLTSAKDNQVPPTGPSPGGSTAGCEAGDFTAAPPAQPAVALVQRGTCDFIVKVRNAVAAGYDAVIIFNEGNTPERSGLLENVTLGAPAAIPVVGISYADGAELYRNVVAGPTTVTVSTSTETDLEAETENIIADSPRGAKDEVVVVGAHLDSVEEGPGINDNGSGSSTILEIAEEMAELGYTDRLQRRVRFAFWGAEESGLLGSEYYVENLNPNQLDRHYANLNFDMVGSPNYVRFVYDGDGSETDPAGPAGSGQIEQIFTDYFSSQGLASEPTEFSGRSDYGPFILAGIPAGGLFTGAEDIKTPEQAAIYGGTAGIAYDPCYHQACDNISNLSTKALFEMGDAAAHAVLTLGRSRSGLYEDGSRQAQSKAAKVSLEAKGHAALR